MASARLGRGQGCFNPYGRDRGTGTGFNLDFRVLVRERRRAPDAPAMSLAGWLLVGGVGFGGALIALLGSGLNRGDEAWAVQVAYRVLHGNRLYGEVAFTTTPLSIWVGAAAQGVFGTEIAVQRTLMALVAALSGVAAGSLMLRLGFSRRTSILTAGMVVITSAIPAGALYQRLATLFVLAAVAVFLPALARGDPTVRLGVVGVLTGACLATKHNQGLFLLAAISAIVLLHNGRFGLRTSLRSIARLSVAAFGVFAIALLPVILAGDLSELYDYTVRGAAGHVGNLSTSYFDGFKQLVDPSGDSPFQKADGVWQAASFLVGPLAVLTLLLAVIRSHGRRPFFVAVLLLLGCALATLYPGADAPHVLLVLPILWVALAIGLDGAIDDRRLRRVVLPAAAAVWILAGVVSTTLQPVADFARGTAHISDVPRFKGVLADRAALDAAARDARMLEDVADRYGTVLLLMHNAQFEYLVTGIKNPTPYDFPLSHVFGPHGEEATAARIRNGDFPSVCMRSLRGPDARQRPAIVERAVRESMHRTAKLPLCELYTS